ncbi:hypothetical protein R4Z09_04550 [Niallia oryzisoli]|uniref:NADH dehydrogenase subunit 6 n=1 Tax=Niallia oryzisoli TaxID=1737571 RepID=A0ABZ2CET1_9BACI
MVTFAFLAVFFLLGSVIVLIDIILLDQSFMEVLRNMFYFQLIQDRVILYSTCIVGFIWAVVVDIRIRRKKGNHKERLSQKRMK